MAAITVPLAARVALACVLVANVGLLVSSNVAIAAEVSVVVRGSLDGVGARSYDIDTGERFSLVDTVREEIADCSEKAYATIWAHPAAGTLEMAPKPLGRTSSPRENSPRRQSAPTPVPRRQPIEPGGYWR